MIMSLEASGRPEGGPEAGPPRRRLAGALLTRLGTRLVAARDRGDHPALQRRCISTRTGPTAARSAAAPGTPRRRPCSARSERTLRPKLRTTLLILLPVAFLALRSPLALVAVPSLALRFVSTNTAYWGTGYALQRDRDADRLHRARSTRWPGSGPTGPGPRARGGRGPAWSPPGRPAATRVIPAAMLAIAVVLAWRFPLQRPVALADVPDQPARPRGGRGAGPGARWVHRGGHADHAGPAGRPGRHLLDRHRRNPAPRYIVFDDLDSGWNPAPSNPLTFVEQRHPGATYRQIYVNDYRVRVPPDGR